MGDVALRYYQSLAVEALEASPSGAVVVIPTGGGKTIVIAETVRRALGWASNRILCLTVSAELVKQNATTIERHLVRRVGIFCAQLREKYHKSRFGFWKQTRSHLGVGTCSSPR